MKKVLAILFVFVCSVTFSQITITSTVTNVSCFGMCNGAISIGVTGGTPGYTYSWSPGGSVSPNPSGLCAGVYSLTVTDASSITATATVSITEPSQLVAITSTTNSPCMGWCAGSAVATGGGGTPPYTYTWNQGATVTWVTNLCVGNYSVTITDMMGCVATQSTSITSPPATNIVTTVTNVACQTSCSGAASATVTGGAGGHTYQWIGPGIASGSTTSNPTGMCAGFYTLVVTDAMGCQTATMVNLAISISNSLPNATITSTSYNETCHLSGDGAVDVSIVGTNPGPFTYAWSNGANTQDITNIISNIYSLSITDGVGNCTTIKDTITATGVNCGTIYGNAYIDNNSDCIKNSGDSNYHNAIILVNPGNRYGYTNTNGDYVINSLPYGTYSVTLVVPPFTPIFPTCTTTLNTTVNSGNQNSTNNNFSIAFNSSTQPDLNVSAWNAGIVPGFTCRMVYYLYNQNNVPASGVYKATLPSAFISNITNVSPAVYTLSGDTIIWNFTNVSYFGGYQTFYVDFVTPLSTPLGSIFTSCIWAQPTVTDLNYVNNTYCYSRYVNGSFDPNDKTVSPVGFGPYNEIHPWEDELTYLIRFQNTGNGPAVNIVVKDTLSPNVDVSTFEMLGASHNYMIDILPGNILRWKFNNIMLADSGSNEPASHGYIQYRIKHTVGNFPGTQIKNTAYIYFDFNAPVVTNTAMNTIEYVTGIQSQSTTNDQWLVYPNPSTGVLNLINNNIASDTKLKIEVVNSFGQLVYEENATANHKTLDISKFANGVYFVKIVSDKQSCVKRVVLSR